MEPLSQRLIAMGSGLPPEYWISEINNPSGSLSARAIRVGATGIYGLADTISALYAYKLNFNGQLVWQRLLSGASQYGAGGIDIDSSENIYVSGYDYNSSDSFSFASIFVKLNSSGTILYQRFLSLPSITDISTDLAIDAAGNILISGYVNDGSTQRGYLAKYSDTPTLLWHRTITTARYYSGLQYPTPDFGEIYVAGVGGASLNIPLITKYTSSGSLTWQKTFGSANSEEIRNISAGSGSTQGLACSTKSIRPGYSDILFFDIFSDASVNWQRALVGSGTDNNFAVDIFFGDNNTTAVCGKFGNGVLIARYSNAGSLAWQRLLTVSSGSIVPVSVSWFGNFVYLVTQVGASRISICRLRFDGGGTGVFGSGTPIEYTYANGTATDTTTSFSFSNTSLTEAAASGFTTGTPTISGTVANMTQRGIAAQ